MERFFEDDYSILSSDFIEDVIFFSYMGALLWL